MPDLIPDALYTRAVIHELLGGDLESYLPHINGQVVCGCFKVSANPNAPEEILVGGEENVVFLVHCVIGFFRGALQGYTDGFEAQVMNPSYFTVNLADVVLFVNVVDADLKSGVCSFR